MTDTYKNEIAFVTRKLKLTANTLTTKEVEWKALAVKSEIVSAPFPTAAAATALITQLREALGKRSWHIFPKMVCSVTSKLSNTTRVVILIPLLREIFGSEIDNDSSGGGKGYNPKTNQPRPPGGRGI